MVSVIAMLSSQRPGQIFLLAPTGRRCEGLFDYTRGRDWWKQREASQASQTRLRARYIVPLRRMRVPQVGLDGDIRAELLKGADAERGKSVVRFVHEGDAGLPAEFWCVEENEFMDDARRKGGAVERGAGFENNAEDFTAAELLEGFEEMDFPFC